MMPDDSPKIPIQPFNALCIQHNVGIVRVFSTVMTRFFLVRVESSNHYRNQTEKVFIFDLLKKLRIIGDRFIKLQFDGLGIFGPFNILK